ncbi:MAG TPA: glucose 1-dehydrogenase [Bryobacteraceae bacterium]|jgi:NAD(P)-dependent dehydrogenase (short-subunit alcohol dehydrogenase family)|nr:glucose 1-dehydrogenase [Bryobacteraceae bacterium]
MKSQAPQLAGKTALITGAGSGLGRAIAIAYAEAGARVAAADISFEKAAETAGMIKLVGGEGIGQALDVTKRREVAQITDEVAQKFGALDILVNSAGRAIRGTALDYKEEDWAAILAVNLTGTFFCCQTAARYMAAQRRGKIINIASIGGFIAYPGSIAYLASKGGVVQLTKGFAVELAPYNVQVNAIAPSLFETPMTASTRSDEDSYKYFMERTPAGRKGHPEEVAGAAIFLAGDGSSMITGHTLAVDGGYLAA